MAKTYSYSGKGEISPSNPHFLNFGKRRKFGKNIVGEIKKLEEKNSIGQTERKIVVQFTLGHDTTYNQVLKALKKGRIS